MNVGMDQILDELHALRQRVDELERRPIGATIEFPLPAKKGSPALRLISMARRDPEAAKAEAKRLSKLDSKLKLKR